MHYSVCVPAVFGGKPVHEALDQIAALGASHYEFWSWWDQDVEKILAPNHGGKAAALRRWLRTELYPKVFPELAAAALLCAFLIVCCPVGKAKAAHHENR